MIIILLLTFGLLNYIYELDVILKKGNHIFTIINIHTTKILLGYNIWFLPIFVLCNVHCFICTGQLFLSFLTHLDGSYFVLIKLLKRDIVPLCLVTCHKIFDSTRYKLFI